MGRGAEGSTLRVMSLGGADGRERAPSLYSPAGGRGRRAELGAMFAVVGSVCLSAFAWAQNPVLPQTLAPVTSPRPADSMALPRNWVGSRYVVAKDDLLEVYIVDLQELSREYRVDGDGMITLPMLSRPVMAAGLTLGQLSEAIRRGLLDGGLLRDPQVIVTVKSSALNSVVLSGAVRKPGVYPVYVHTTLLDVLAQAEGLGDDAGGTAIINRAENGPGGAGPNAPRAAPDDNSVIAHTVKVDVCRLWQNGDASLNLDLYPGDRVMVQRAGMIYVVGGVNRAGAFVLSNQQEQMTVLKAIALAGNFTREAKPAKAMIIRKASNAPGGKQEVHIDLKKVLSNRAPDQQLLASDILYVPESGVRVTLDTVLNTAVNASVWRIP